MSSLRFSYDLAITHLIAFRQCSLMEKLQKTRASLEQNLHTNIWHFSIFSFYFNERFFFFDESVIKVTQNVLSNYFRKVDN